MVQAEGRAWMGKQNNERAKYIQRTEIPCGGNLGCIEESGDEGGWRHGETGQ